MDGLGNEARQRKLDLKGNSSKMQNNVSVTSSIGKTAISQVVLVVWLGCGFSGNLGVERGYEVYFRVELACLGAVLVLFVRKMLICGKLGPERFPNCEVGLVDRSFVDHRS